MRNWLWLRRQHFVMKSIWLNEFIQPWQVAHFAGIGVPTLDTLSFTSTSTRNPLLICCSSPMSYAAPLETRGMA